MLENILPLNIINGLKKININNLYEIRIRANKPVIVSYYGAYYYLGENGVNSHKSQAIILDENEIANIIYRASNYSIYAVNEQITNGFITLSGGVRIGLVGQVVVEKNDIITIKDFSSINIRIPHEVKGISDKIIDYLFKENDFLSTLIISPAGAGKTTLLRDLIRNLASEKYSKNVLVIDERNEISSSVNGNMQLDLGDFCDVIVSSTKQLGFMNGIRSMSPEIIATDEIGSEQDVKTIMYATTCGASVIAIIHAKNLVQLQNKKDMELMLKNKLFSRYVFLSSRKGKGTI